MKRAWIAINLVLGPLVLASYVGAAAVFDSDTLGRLWGAVPEAVRPFYIANMFLAAAGYLVAAGHIARNVSASDVKILGRFGFGVFNLAYLMILTGSALWMPLTGWAIEHSAVHLVPLIFLDLAVVAVGSLLLAAALGSARPRRAPRMRLAALIGVGAFCVQTVLLDGVVWPLGFSV